MSRPFARLPGLAVLAVALSAGLWAAGAAAGSLPRSAPPRLAQPSNLSPRALAVWRWRQEQDRRPAMPSGVAIPDGIRRGLDDAPETLLNDTTGTIGNDQDQLAAASQPGRNIVLVWRDNRTGDGDIRCQMFDPAGNPINAANDGVGDFLVNDDGAGYSQARPAVAMNSLGAFAIVWTDPRNGPTDIFLQKFKPDGTRDSSNVKVNIGRDETARNSHDSPSVDIDDVGHIVVAWTDDRRGATTDIYVARIRPDLGSASNLAPFAGSVSVNTPGVRIEPVDNVAPSIRFTRQSPEDSGFVLVWQAKDIANRGGRRLALARRLNSFDRSRGFPLDTLIVPVNDVFTNTSSDARGASSPVLLAASAADTSRAMVVAWVDSAGPPDTLKARLLFPSQWSRTVAPFRGASVVVSDAEDAASLAPALARLADGSILAAWTQSADAGGNAAVRVRHFGADLAPNGPGEALNSSGADLPRTFPYAVGGGNSASSGSWLAAWGEQHGASLDVMVRHGGSDAGADSMLLDERQPDQIHVDLAYNAAGQGVAVWADYRDGQADPDIYAQRVDASASAVGANFRVNSDPVGAYQENPRVGVDATGNFTVVWEDTRLGTFQIFARRFGAGGTPQGAEFAVSETDTSQQFRPAIGMTPAGAAAVVWEDNRRGFRTDALRVFDIYLQPLATDGSLLGNTVRVSPVLGDSNAVGDPNNINLQAKLNPSVAVDSAGNGLAFWDVVAKVTQGGSDQIVDNPDVDGRYFAAPSQLPDMQDGAGRAIQSLAFSVADSTNSGFLFPQLRSNVAYAGAGLYVVTFEDERLGLLSREDIRGRLVGVGLSGGNATIYTPSPTFAVNDDIYALPPDPLTGEVKLFSSSQFEPVVAANPLDHTISIAWSDRRTGTSYNVMRQSYRILPGSDLSEAPGLRFLGRNSFCNADYPLTELAHGSPAVAYSADNRVVVGWQSNQLNGVEDDVWARALLQAPDTCAQDTCSSSAVRGGLQAVLGLGGAVTLTWQVEGAAASADLVLLRHDLALESVNPSATPIVIAASARLLAGGEIQDQLGGEPGNYVYQLLADGQVLGIAGPRVREARFSAALGKSSPNPARGMTRVQFIVPGRAGERTPVSLRVYDVTGREVSRLADGPMSAGEYSLEWRGDTHSGHASAGVYFLRFAVGAEVMTHKLLWLR